MAVHNRDIAAAFEEMADLLDIQGANPFRIRAYRNAARAIDELSIDLASLLAKGEELPRIPGIGADLAGKIRELCAKGRLKALASLRRQVPPGLSDLLKLPALGPKRVQTLYRKLGIHTSAQLRRAIHDGRLRSVAGFGPAIEAQLSAALAAAKERPERLKLAVAAQYAEPLRAYLAAVPGVVAVEVAGSYRRARETVGDIDIVVAARSGSPVIERFAGYEEVAQVMAQGPTRASVALRSGLQVDLRSVEPDSFGAALVYFTGSKAHNIALRRIAQGRGLKINEYGVFEGVRRIAGKTEADVYRTIGLPCIPPELREDWGEIEAARANKLPDLIEQSALKGDLHLHTRATDGHDTIAAMAEAARAAGLSYVAVTEHSKHLAMAHGLDPKRLMAQADEIDRINTTLSGMTILKGIEVDILEDGSLDLPDDVLGRLDLVVAAVHSGFHLSREKQTARILKAMERPHFSILAHPSGRLISEREPYDVDMARIIHAARERGCFLELNAHPARLDLLDIHCRKAKEEGVLVAISSDAHSVGEFANLKFGVLQARRGWLAKEDVLNARPLAELRRLLKKTM